MIISICSKGDLKDIMTLDSIDLDAGLFGGPGDKILLPLMGYPSERDAIFVALTAAEYFGINLYILHITSKSSKIEDYFLNEINNIKRRAAKLKVNLEINILEHPKWYAPDSVILNEITTLAPKLTIMMSRRKGLFQRLSGSIAERVARKSPHSVMIIRSPIKDWVTYGSQISPRKIIVPIGGRTNCETSAVQLAIAIANAGESQDADITLLHSIIVPETVPILDTDNKMFHAEEKKFIKLAGTYSTMLMFPMKTKVIVGRDIGRSVSQYINKVQADLAIMGVHYVPRKFFGLFGTDTNEIYNNSECPVMVIFHKEQC